MAAAGKRPFPSVALKSIPFMDFDGNPGHKPVIAMDVYDTPPDDWNEALTKPFADVLNDPARWAKKCVRAVWSGFDMP